MPIYEYRCDKGHNFEVMQRMTDDPVTACSECGAPVQRVFHPVAVHFKGSGFYNTDYGKKKKGASTDSAGSDSGKSSDASSTTASDKKGEGSSSSSTSESSKSSKTSSSD